MNSTGHTQLYGHAHELTGSTNFDNRFACFCHAIWPVDGSYRPSRLNTGMTFVWSAGDASERYVKIYRTSDIVWDTSS